MPKKQGPNEPDPATGKTPNQVKREKNAERVADPLRDPANEPPKEPR